VKRNEIPLKWTTIWCGSTGRDYDIGAILLNGGMDLEDMETFVDWITKLQASMLERHG